MFKAAGIANHRGSRRHGINGMYFFMPLIMLFWGFNEEFIIISVDRIAEHSGKIPYGSGNPKFYIHRNPFS